MADLEFRCTECPHVFTAADILKENDDNKIWGHPCFWRPRSIKDYRCESYRACFQVERIKSPICGDSYEPVGPARREP